MRTINYIAVHCTATPQTSTVENIKKYWKEALGWKTVGYHYIIAANGECINLLPIEQASNGVKGFNSETINIAYIGGVDAKGNPVDNRTEYQLHNMINLLRELKAKFPDAEIKGHKDFPNVHKACPSFDVKAWLETIKL